MSLKRQIHQKIPNSWISGGDIEKFSFPYKDGGFAKGSTVARALRDMSAQDENGEILEIDFPLLKREKKLGRIRFIQYCRNTSQPQLI